MSLPSFLSFGPGLLYFAIYAPSLSTVEGSEHQQILFYTASNPPPFSDAKHTSDCLILTNSAIVNKNSQAAGNVRSPPLRSSPNPNSPRHQTVQTFVDAQNKTDLEESSSQKPLIFSNETVVSLETKLKHIGLAQALTSFSKIFNEPDSPINLKTKKTIIIVVQVEIGVWASLCVCLPRKVVPLLDSDFKSEAFSTSTPNAKSKKHRYSITYNHDTEFISQLESFVHGEYQTFMLLNGPIAPILPPEPGSGPAVNTAKKNLRKFFSTTVWGWDKRWNQCQNENENCFSSAENPKTPKNTNYPIGELSLLGSSRSIPRMVPGADSLSNINLLWNDILSLKTFCKPEKKAFSSNLDFQSNESRNSGRQTHKMLYSNINPEVMLIFNNLQQLVWSSLTDSSYSLGEYTYSPKNDSTFHCTRSLHTYIKKIFADHFDTSLQLSKEKSAGLPHLNSFIKQSNVSKLQLGTSASESADDDSSSESSTQSSISFSSPNNPFLGLPNSFTGAFSTVVTALVEPTKKHTASNIPFFQDSINATSQLQSRLVAEKAPPLLAKQNVLSENSTVKLSNNNYKSRNHSVASLTSIQSLSHSYAINNKTNLHGIFNFVSTTPRLFTGNPDNLPKNNGKHREQNQSQSQSSHFQNFAPCTPETFVNFTNQLLAPLNSSLSDISRRSTANTELILDKNDIIWISKNVSQSTRTSSELIPVHLVAIKFDQLLFIILVNASSYVKTTRAIQALSTNKPQTQKESEKDLSTMKNRNSGAIGTKLANREASMEALVAELAWKKADLKSTGKMVKKIVSNHSAQILTHLKYDFAKIIYQTRKCVLPTIASKVPLLFINEHKLFAVSNFNNIAFVPIGSEALTFDSISPLSDYIPNSLDGFKTKQYPPTLKKPTTNPTLDLEIPTQALSLVSTMQLEQQSQPPPVTSTVSASTSSGTNSTACILPPNVSNDTAITEPVSTGIVPSKGVGDPAETSSSKWNFLGPSILSNNPFGVSNWFGSAKAQTEENNQNSNETLQTPQTKQQLVPPSTPTPMPDQEQEHLDTDQSLRPQNQNTPEQENTDTKLWYLFSNFYKLNLNINLNPFSAQGAKKGDHSDKPSNLKSSINYSYFPKQAEQTLITLSEQFSKELSLEEQFVKIPGCGWIGAKRVVTKVDSNSRQSLSTKFVWYCYINSEKASLYDIKVYMKQVSASYFVGL